MEGYLTSQYLAALGMLKACAENYDPQLWRDCTDHRNPAGQIAYHTAFYANIYLGPSRSGAVRWPGEVPHMEDLKRPTAAADVLPRPEIAEFVDHIAECLPKYLGRLSVDSDCWPHWYSLSQMEFHINNLRHIQHHVGELIERHRAVKSLSLPWSTFEPIADRRTER